ncbi:hypothetical protein M1N79_00170 [Dehalococcoidia bacterium]|nr:hypothetical protein [Dehalococcoidia bacterium]
MINRAFEESLAKRLAEQGEEMNLEISSDQDYLIRTSNGSDYFPGAIANAFTWTGHAVSEEAFFEFAINYLTTGKMASLSTTEAFSGRFGPERLTSALQGWKAIMNGLGEQDVLSCDAQGLYNIQQQCLDIVYRLLNQRRILGVGPWLFCAPFKIIAAHRKDLWKSESLDDILMPLGLEVVRGIRKLIQHGCTYAQGLDESMLSEEEGGLMEGMGTVALVQGVSRKVAQISKTRVLHINSGLYLYGKGEL